jgi:hypothetical protein
MVIDGYCKQEKILDNYRKKVEERVNKKYNGRIQRRCMEHYLTPDEEKMFPPQLKDLAYAENKDTETKGKSEEHDTADFHLYSITSDSDNKSSSSSSSDSSDSSIGTQSKAKSMARKISEKEQMEIEIIQLDRIKRLEDEMKD